MITQTTSRLEDLERAVVLGQKALIERNRMVVELADAGHSGASIYHRLNAVRAEEGAQPLTPDAVYVTIRRGRDARAK
jgi:hypothetical protein